MRDRHESAFTVVVGKDGPLLVSGAVTLRRMTIEPVGRHYEYRDGGEIGHAATFSLCRCGQSGNAPFCDGTHASCGFEGDETAPREPLAERARRYKGEGIVLLDDYDLCALARFCHTDRGDIWSMMKRSGDEAVRAEILKAADECPAGRLVVLDKATGKSLESRYPDEIVVLKDPQRHCDGPLWVRGDFTLVGADGPYEKRSKCTLCRCGHSAIKPLCDSEHAFTHWSET